jgi:hypothetical protein
MIFLSYFLILRNNFRLFRTTTKKESTVSVSSEHDQLFDKITELVRRHHQQKESILVLRISLKSGKLLGGAWGGGRTQYFQHAFRTVIAVYLHRLLL